MEAIYIDLHIHTSENADKLNDGYQVKDLIENIMKFNQGSKFLISMTDHNTINKVAYSKLDKISKTSDLCNYLVGVELSVKNYATRPFYHCHFYFNLNDIEAIDIINKKLDVLYPKKMVSDEDQVPTLEAIIKSFNDFDFLVLPHGGQSHRVFNESIEIGERFDSILERNLYYNMFDGFTSRSDKGTEKTHDYFKRLGIDEVVNLVTSTDNYVIKNYPNDKSNSDNFVPTWMLAEPTFNGLRISLSDKDRFIYNEGKPDLFSDVIKGAQLNNELIDLDVKLTSGLNVIIGGSSSGKSLLAEAIYNRIINKGDLPSEISEKYGKYNISEVFVDNPSGRNPYYISQNYITKIIQDSSGDEGIRNIDIINKLFKYDDKTLNDIKKHEKGIRELISNLVDTIIKMQGIKKNLNKINHFPRLIVKGNTINPLSSFYPNASLIKFMTFHQSEYDEHVENVNQLKEFTSKNIFFNNIDSLISKILQEINKAYSKSLFELRVRKVIENDISDYSSKYLESSKEKEQKLKDKDSLYKLTEQYIEEKINLLNYIEALKTYEYSCDSKNEESNGHELTISNNLKINSEVLLETINKCVKSGYRIENLDQIDEDLFNVDKLSDKPKISHDNIKSKITQWILDNNKISYDIKTKDGKNFRSLSPGWKTAIVLDLVLGYKDDYAPIIIDQPEDNLASEYINNTLIKSLKKAKKNRQIIIITHSATIPLLGDAQNIILCKIDEDGNFITIKSGSLEGTIGEIDTVDHIVDITDGGKITVKKRIKKYNLKKIIKEDN